MEPRVLHDVLTQKYNNRTPVLKYNGRARDDMLRSVINDEYLSRKWIKKLVTPFDSDHVRIPQAFPFETATYRVKNTFNVTVGNTGGFVLFIFFGAANAYPAYYYNISPDAVSG